MWPQNVEGRDEEEERAGAEVQQRWGRGFKEQSRQHFLIGINLFWEFEILLPCLVPFFIDDEGVTKDVAKICVISDNKDLSLILIFFCIL